MIFYFIICWLLGNFMTAQLLSRLRGQNMKELGSGNVGARNAGRALGKYAFFLTVLGDGGKALVAMAIGHIWALSPTVIAIGCVLCVIGHVWPFWLHFKGGMGVATCMSAMIFLTPLAFLTFFIGFLLCVAFTRSLTFAMVAGFATYAIGLLSLQSAA